MEERSYIGEPFEAKKLYEKIGVYVSPPFPNTEPNYQRYRDGFSDLRDAVKEQFKQSPLGVQMIMPFTFIVEGEEPWTIPFEPAVSLVGANKITRRYPQKGKKGGSIKEKWTQDDYEISIKGYLIDPSGNNYPEEDVKRMRKYKDLASVGVECPILTLFGIDRMVITKLDLPHTSGKALQAFSMSAISDQLFNGLLIEV